MKKLIAMLILASGLFLSISANASKDNGLSLREEIAVQYVAAMIASGRYNVDLVGTAEGTKTGLRWAQETIEVFKEERQKNAANQ